MAFKLDNFVIDRILRATAENTNGDILYVLSQLADATIEITSESKESRDKDGTLIKKFYTGKSGTFSANSALVDFNILGSSTGSGKEQASTTATIKMPYMAHYAKGTASATVPGVVAESVKVIGLDASGNHVASYKKETAAGAAAFSVSDTTIALPTDTTIAEFLIKAERTVSSGIKIANKADAFPDTVRLTLEVVGISPCTPDIKQKMYVVFPSFQPSPDVSVSLATDAQLAYNGDLQVAYCDENGKVLYEIYVAEDDTE